MRFAGGCSNFVGMVIRQWQFICTSNCETIYPLLMVIDDVLDERSGWMIFRKTVSGQKRSYAGLSQACGIHILVHKIPSSVRGGFILICILG